MPPASVVVVNESAGTAGATVIEKSCVAVRAGSPPSVARSVKGYVPAAVGVPEMETVDVPGPSERPGGRLPAASSHV